MKDYSYSRLDLFEKCPFAFRCKYIDKLPEAPSEALAFGSLVHDIIHAYGKHCLKSRVATDITAMPAIVNGCFYAKPSGLSSDRYREVLQVAEAFASSHTYDAALVVGLEEWIRINLTGKYVFRGIVDRLEIMDSLAIITDWKTDFQIRTQADVENDFQLSVYAWLITLEYPQIEQIKIALDFVRWGAVREAMFDAGEVGPRVEEQVMGLIAQVEKAIAAKKLDPRPGSFCDWCGFVMHCPAAKSLPPDMRQITTDDDARAVAAQLALLEKQVKIRKVALKKYCNIAGTIEANGLAWGFHLTPSQTIEDIDGFVAAMKSKKLDPRPYLRLDGTAAKKLWNDPALADVLAPLVIDRSYTKFDSRKMKGGDE